MFGIPVNSYEGLTGAQREELADFLDARNTFAAAQMTCNSMRIKVLRSPSEAAQQELNDYSSLVVSPAKRDLMEKQMKLVKGAFDIEGLQSMIPMILAGLMQSIDLTILLNVVDLEPDQIEEGLTMIRQYLSSAT